MGDEEVVLLKVEYEVLLKDFRFLECLRRFGVDNWEWYGDACDRFREDYPEYND